MAFDFPTAPAVDEIYTDAVSGMSYVWTGVLWKQGTTTSAPPGDAWVLKVGDTMTGALVLPDPDPVSPLQSTHKRYVDTIVATNALYQGVWNVAANTPDLNVPPNAPLNGYSWLAQTVDPAIPEIADANIPGIGGSSIAALDTVKWNATSLEYDHIRGATGISQMTIADAAPVAAFHGQCWWDSDSGKQYVYYDDGTSQAWVQMSGGGGGQASVTVSATAPVAPTKGMLWWDTTSGVLYVWYDDGTTTQWVQTNVEEAPIDGAVYSRSNAAWVLGGGGAGTPYAVPVGAAMPATALQGELFFNSTDASLYIWFDDGTSAQWVEVSASGSGGATGDYLPLTGGVLTGHMTINYTSAIGPGDPQGSSIYLNKVISSQQPAVVFGGVAGVQRWKVNITGDFPSVGADNFQIVSTNDGGGGAVVMEIARATGDMVYGGNMTVYGTVTETLLMDAAEADPTLPGNSVGALLLHALAKIKELEARLAKAKL